jgi:hypothetical protein
MTTTVMCIVIVAESVVEKNLIEDMHSCGARGWTLTAARGHGPRDRRLSEIEGGNIRVEILASEEVTTRIWEALEAKYFPHFAITAWAFPVSVARASRYLS